MIGLGATVAVMFYFKAAQPALFYLVPACLIAAVGTALWRKGMCVSCDHSCVHVGILLCLKLGPRLTTRSWSTPYLISLLTYDLILDSFYHQLSRTTLANPRTHMNDFPEGFEGDFPFPPHILILEYA